MNWKRQGVVLIAAALLLIAGAAGLSGFSIAESHTLVVPSFAFQQACPAKGSIQGSLSASLSRAELQWTPATLDSFDDFRMIHDIGRVSEISPPNTAQRIGLYRFRRGPPAASLQ